MNIVLSPGASRFLRVQAPLVNNGPSCVLLYLDSDNNLALKGFSNPVLMDRFINSEMLKVVED